MRAVTAEKVLGKTQTVFSQAGFWGAQTVRMSAVSTPMPLTPARTRTIACIPYSGPCAILSRRACSIFVIWSMMKRRRAMSRRSSANVFGGNCIPQHPGPMFRRLSPPIPGQLAELATSPKSPRKSLRLIVSFLDLNPHLQTTTGAMAADEAFVIHAERLMSRIDNSKQKGSF